LIKKVKKPAEYAGKCRKSEPGNVHNRSSDGTVHPLSTVRQVLLTVRRAATCWQIATLAS
jgi:hypothetical protein